MNPAIALLSAALLSASGPGTAPSDAEARAQVTALLGTIDRTIPAGHWRALGPAAIPVLAEVASSPGEPPTRRSKALGALAAVDPARATAVSRALAEADAAPASVRETAVRVLGRTLPPDALRAAVAPLLRAAPEASLRAVAAETLARHAPERACAEVMDQALREQAADRPAFERAASICSARPAR